MSPGFVHREAVFVEHPVEGAHGCKMDISHRTLLLLYCRVRHLSQNFPEGCKTVLIQYLTKT
jgi:hypothetical protein